MIDLHYLFLIQKLSSSGKSWIFLEQFQIFQPDVSFIAENILPPFWIKKVVAL